MIASSNQEVLNETANRTEGIYGDMNNILDKVSLHPSIQNILKNESEITWEGYQNARFFSEYTNLLMVGYPEIHKISIYDQQGKRFDSIGRYLEPYYDEYTPYPEIEKKLTEKSIAISSIYTGEHNTKMISFGKKIFDASNGQSIGTAVIDINLNFLSDSFKEIMLLRSGYIVLLDEENKVIYHPSMKSGSNVSEQLMSIASKSNGMLHQTQRRGEFLFLSKEVQHIGWKIIGVVPYTEVSEKLMPIRNQFLLIAIMIIISVVVSAILIYRLLVKPIRKLQKSMSKVQSGDFSVRVNFERNDEIGNLGKHFNDMVNQTEVLINRVYQVELNESRALLLQKQAEIIALQEKITPHFLYNTLNTISWFAHRRGVREIQLVVDSLSEMLRYSLKSSGKFVSLEEEIEYLKLYADIINFRYENTFFFSYNIKQETECALVPRLFLQPIVENSIKHGFLQEQQEKNIRIEAGLQQEKFVIMIQDNGIGITEQRLEEINRHLHKPENQSSEPISDASELGIGLLNVHQRLQLTYGHEYGITLQSKLGQGTTVTLIVPSKIVWGEENETNSCNWKHQPGYSQPG